MCPFCIATAALMAATTAASLGGLAAVATVKIRPRQSSIDPKAEADELPSNRRSKLEERHAS